MTVCCGRPPRGGRFALGSGGGAATTILAALWFSLGAAPVAAQEHPIQVTASLLRPDAPRRPGDTLRVQVDAAIPPGWHLYSITQPPGGPIPTTIAVDPDTVVRIEGTISGPVPEINPDPNFDVVTETYEDSARFELPLRVATMAAPGQRGMDVRVAYQTCNNRYCLPPTEDTVRLSLLVEGAVAAPPQGGTAEGAEGAVAAHPQGGTAEGAVGAVAAHPQGGTAEGAEGAEVVGVEGIAEGAEASAGKEGSAGGANLSGSANAGPTGTPVGSADLTRARAGAASAGAVRATGRSVAEPLEGQGSTRGLLLFLWLAATMGALSLLTPCVFPMVPITISYFSRHEGGGRGRAVGDAVLYAGGIVGAFTLLGLGLAMIMGVAGLNRFAASPWLNLAIAALFIAFALSLFGVFELAVPGRLLTWLNQVSQGNRTGRVGTTLLMGVTFAVTTFTCTAPFVGTLLVSAARGDWRWPAAGLLTFSSVFALPFLLLALVPRALTRLPRSGEWMVTLKGTLGFIELAASMKFISNADLVEGWSVFTRDVVVVIWMVIGVLLVLYLMGVRASRPRLRGGAFRHPIPATLALVATVWLATGLGGRRLGELESFLPPAGAGASGVANGTELSWLVNDYSGALAQARTQQRLVLIDFTGYTCTNCRWMEANMFPRPAVSRALERFVRVRLFTDGRGEPDRSQQALEQQMFRTVALPLYAVVDSLGAARATFLGMTRDTREFVDFLDGAETTN